MRETKEKATSMLNMDKNYHVTARRVLPILVRQAKIGKDITYSNLSAEIAFKAGPRNLNYPPGSIGVAMHEIGQELGLEIPPINLLAVDKQHGKPGTGAGALYKSEEFLRLPKWRQQEIMLKQYRPIFEFQYWDQVLNFLKLDPSDFDFIPNIEDAENYRGGGESQEHKDLKEYVSKNPQILGLLKNSEKGKIERCLPSGDSVDVYFSRRNLDIAVEVKPSNAPAGDLARGIFQCVKYKAVIEARQLAKNHPINVRAVLITTATLPPRLIKLKNTLGVEVIDQLMMTSAKV